MKKEEYLALVEEQVRAKKARPMIREELSNHMDDQAEYWVLQGKSEEEAEERAVREMGDPVITGEMLDQVHRPKSDWVLPTLAILLSLIGVVMQIIIAKHLENSNLSDSVSHLSLDTIVSNLIGIGMMFLLYLGDYRKIHHYAWGLVILCLGLAGLPRFMGFDYRQSFLWINLVYRLEIPIFAAFVYRFVGQGTKGLLKSMGLLGLMSIVPLFMSLTPNTAGMLVTVICCSVLMLYAIVKKMYGGKRWLQYTIWGMIHVGLPGVFLVDILFVKGRIFGLANYQIQRIKTFFLMMLYHMGLGDDSELEYASGFMMHRSWLQVRDASLWGSRELGELGDYTSSYSESVLTCIFTYWGAIAGVVVIALVAAFLIRCMRLSLTQPNRFGKLLGCNITLYLLVVSFFYVLSNLGCFAGTGMEMPFLSYGKIATISHYALIGVVLSIYRYSTVFGEPKRKEKRMETRSEGSL